MPIELIIDPIVIDNPEAIKTLVKVLECNVVRDIREGKNLFDIVEEDEVQKIKQLIEEHPDWDNQKIANQYIDEIEK